MEKMGVYIDDALVIFKEKVENDFYFSMYFKDETQKEVNFDCYVKRLGEKNELVDISIEKISISEINCFPFFGVDYDSLMEMVYLSLYKRKDEYLFFLSNVNKLLSSEDLKFKSEISKPRFDFSNIFSIKLYNETNQNAILLKYDTQEEEIKKIKLVDKNKTSISILECFFHQRSFSLPFPLEKMPPSVKLKILFSKK